MAAETLTSDGEQELEQQQREGGDITAADMISPVEDPSEIVEFFTGSTIFLTGSTGFLGKILLEKLLRTCNGLKCVFLLVRQKKGKDIEKRFEEIFEGPNFETVRRKFPNYKQKVVLMSGDCTLPDLGLNEYDKNRIINEVDCVIHCAATVRFDEKLRTATYINVRSVKDLMAMGKDMIRLRAMIYVSTAFSNCIRTKIDETFYDAPMAGDKLLDLVETLEDDKLDQITPILLGDYPNTYVFTKAVAEDIVRKHGTHLPIAIYRPAIVIASVKEPVAGWIDNLYGPTGVLVGAALGVLRSLHALAENVAEMVPADYVVNCCLAATWDVATIKSLNDNKESEEERTAREEKFEKEIPIYNFVSSTETKITWNDFTKLSEHHCRKVPSPLVVWHYFFSLKRTRLAHLLAIFFFHTIPAYIVDFLAICVGKKPLLVKGYQKINKFADVIAYFSTREWEFKNANVQSLWKRMNKQDKQLFEYSMRGFNWDTYFFTYVRGLRVYLLKDPLDTIPQGTVKYYKVMVAHYTVVTILCALLLYLFYVFYSFLF